MRRGRGRSKRKIRKKNKKKTGRKSELSFVQKVQRWCHVSWRRKLSSFIIKTESVRGICSIKYELIPP